MAGFPQYLQPDEMACGATCLRMIAKFYGKNYAVKELMQASGTTREGINLQGLSQAAEKIGFRTLGVKVPLSKLIEDAPLPCIAHWNQNHFVVIYKIKKNNIYVADPGHGKLMYSKNDFIKSWVSDGKDEGILLLLETTPEFYSDKTEKQIKEIKQSFSFLFNYLKAHRKAVIQLLIGLLAGSLLQLIFPFLTQSIIDIGVQNKDVTFIYLILFSQLMVFFGRITIEIIRNYVLMHISSRINISLVSDFFVKLMKLPISYFDTKMTGDIMQRINDNHRIEQFLTGSSLNTLFSIFNFLIFSGVLAFYSLKIFVVFLVGTIFYFLWISFFLKRRADLDYKLFSQSSQNQSKVMELVNGMQEIKLHNAERQKRWQWEALQVKLFKINLKGLSLTTAQNSGSQLINELKNIIITFLAAKLVLDGQVTLGMMLSISYIIGQLNAPVIEMVNFIQHLQDAKLSLERLSEIHDREDEEPINKEYNHELEKNVSLHIQDLTFKYEGVGNEAVLKDVSITIPSNKITAIVGSSGSGKTTLMKLLMKFYEPTTGSVILSNEDTFQSPSYAGNTVGLDLTAISVGTWRDKCGVVMQEGYIFNDTIANNIAVGVDVVDKERLKHAVFVANIKEFIEGLPLGYNTKIGMEGIGISTGQKQRILIARSVYKNPDYLFFDEATSALDANNEKIIMRNLNDFFKGKTVVIIAHRLSTVKNADQIIVLDKGKIIETGNHTALTAQRGAYYELVKNQLELGN
jgi:ATP-binding cassette, subfamily B, bacterial